MNILNVPKTHGIDYILDHLPYDKFKTILDIGCGDCHATNIFHNNKKQVTALGLNIEDYGVKISSLQEKGIEVIEDNFFEYEFGDNKYDAVWAAHIMEHTLNPGLFIEKIKSILSSDGYAIITVPPYKTAMVGGHVTTGWTLGQMAYVLLLLGFDIKNGQFIQHGYNLTAIVQLSNQKLPKINHDKGDLELLASFFPNELCIKQGCEGDVYSINWPYPITKTEKRYRSRAMRGRIISLCKTLFLQLKTFKS